MFLSLRETKAFRLLEERWKIINFSGYYALKNTKTVLVNYFEEFWEGMIQK